jgi:hypothetical protein
MIAIKLCINIANKIKIEIKLLYFYCNNKNQNKLNKRVSKIWLKSNDSLILKMTHL